MKSLYSNVLFSLVIAALCSACSSMQGTLDNVWVSGSQQNASNGQANKRAEDLMNERRARAQRNLEQSEIDQERVAVPVERLPSMRERNLSSIELLWEIPKKPVTGYRISYGYSRDTLDKNVKVSVNELEQFNDQSHGQVYRYFLQNVPADKPTYVSMVAIESGKESPPTPVVEVRPGATSENAPPLPRLNSND